MVVGWPVTTVPLFRLPASVTDPTCAATELVTTGASLVPVMVIVTVAVDMPPLSSVMV